MKYFDILGHKCRDVVTGFEGVAETLSFDLYGCVQVVVRPLVTKPGDYLDGRWFDYNRLMVISQTRVMPIPIFDDEDKGPADKPDRSEPPSR